MCFSNFISIRFRIFLLHLWLPYKSPYTYNPLFFLFVLCLFRNRENKEDGKDFCVHTALCKKGFFPFLYFLCWPQAAHFTIFYFSSAILNIFFPSLLPPSIFTAARISSKRYIYKDSIENVIVWHHTSMLNLNLICVPQLLKGDLSSPT